MSMSRLETGSQRSLPGHRRACRGGHRLRRNGSGYHGRPADARRLPARCCPWKTGNTWTYQVNDEGVMSAKITTVGDQEPVGGIGPNKDVMAYKVVTKKSQMDQTVSWQAPLGDSIVRYREQAFSASTGDLELEEHWDPHKLHVDGSAEHKVTDATWLENISRPSCRSG